MNSIYRLYVGLSGYDTQEVIDGDQVISWVARQVDSFTVLTTQGFFRGNVEDTLVFTLSHDDQHFVINLAHKLRAQLNQKGIGLEYDGAYHRMTYENDPLIYEVAKQPRRYPSFNVRVHSDLRTHRNWCRANEVSVTVFENFDGGDWNFFIFEFGSLEDAKAFAIRFGIQDEDSLWVEPRQGEIHYIALPAVAGTGAP
jgi:hypothetical protein